ncbi:Rho GTPase-activating protein 20 [Manis javanica]|nr:Rho GTPase-activating protein 20 [Manis javanica]
MVSMLRVSPGTWPGINKVEIPTGRVKKSASARLACWKGSGTCPDSPSLALPTAKPGQLFGTSLTCMCDNDKLPNPILDLLDFINQKWPLSRAVFWTATSAESCRALKEQLNSRDKVDWDGESIYVAVAVLKDFPENIQGRESEDENITATRRIFLHLNQ